MSTILSKEFKMRTGRILILRSAQAKDASQIIKLMKSVIAEGPLTLAEPDEYSATVSSESKKILRFKSAPGKIYLVAEVGNDIAGFLSFDNWDTRRTAHTGLFSVFLKKQWRGMGIGRILVQGMIDWGKANPLNRKISLYVFSTNKNAIALYKKLGFKIEGKFLNDMIINGKYVHSVAMCIFTKKP
ncbi:MAG: GNAT family N-acetyltransferase [Ignavibacteria bacterium]|nr:GNAT family N-acetyltransferase [Ignavibacteria bacterium]